MTMTRRPRMEAFIEIVEILAELDKESRDIVLDALGRIHGAGGLDYLNRLSIADSRRDLADRDKGKVQGKP